MKLFKKLSTKHFVIAHLSILAAGLIFLTVLYYLLNIQYQHPQDRFLNGPVTSAPKSLVLSLDQPDDDSLSFNSDIVVSGQTAPVSDVLIYTQSSDTVIKSRSDGSFSTVLTLDEGINKISVVTFDTKGESRSAERMVYYSKEKI